MKRVIDKPYYRKQSSASANRCTPQRTRLLSEVKVRTSDKPYYTYSVMSSLNTGIYVKCPKCNGLGIITGNEDAIHFRCTNCYTSKVKKYIGYKYKVNNQCDNCGRYYKVTISGDNKYFPVLRVACPYCNYIMAGKVQKSSYSSYIIGKVYSGCEPYFGFELWFLTNYKGQYVWALNREHLVYLIDYLSADLREDPILCGTVRTQADQLPAFMKTAKNRDSIVKCLKKMLNK